MQSTHLLALDDLTGFGSDRWLILVLELTVGFDLDRFRFSSRSRKFTTFGELYAPKWADLEPSRCNDDSSGCDALLYL